MSTPMQDVKTVEPSGESVQKLPYGVSFHDVVTHVDGRGSVVELFDPRWGWHKDPLVFAYSFSIRPGMVKGWAVHKKHDDRYFILIGEMKVVLYDDRPESPTYRLVSEIYMSDYRRRLMNIPAGVWHADQNVGSEDLVVVNFPTIQYEHDNPDKYRLPLDNDYIPYKFDGPRGW
ncbi:MAG: dTDP-4-dehydrorhamnose 3,5-epimerase family protein [Rubrivivax sp.]|nr:dTDP-4-dehydrorhamnose 3,5-epimerase family protein [Pyrinomonadaceae bacterium]